ncbi:MAG: hypothetical protein LBD20_01695 [Spirochaetaceae bacterium]|jgi:hypothetical protein|nr:hypothetical protein [Spirochaetaceae bacterium]
MYPQKLFKEIAPLVSVFLVLFVFLIALLVRRPVVVVTDKFFTALYGPHREQAKMLENTFRTQRRVRIFRVGDETDNSVIAKRLSLEIKNPYCVIFPYRYFQIAALYAEENPSIKAYVLSERNLTQPATGKAIYVPTAWQEDFKKAGYLAAMISHISQNRAVEGEARDGRSTNAHKTILLLTHENPLPEAQESFEEGIAQGNWPGDHNILSNAASLPQSSIVSAVLLAPASSFVQGAANVPSIVFSALDLHLLPDFIKIVMDDSPWAMLPSLVQQTAAPPRKDA